MRMAVHPVQNRRIATRNNVHQTVRWNHNNSEDQTGEILDISTTGAFLTSGGKKPYQLQVDDSVSMTVPIDEVEHTLSASVRWVGKSAEHKEIGIGLEFDKDSQTISNEHLLCALLQRRL